MRFEYPILAILLSAAVIASGCIGQPGGQQGGNTYGQDQTPPPQQPPPGSPSILQPGDWSRMATTSTSAAPVEFTYKSVDATVKGIAFSGIEVETSTANSLVLWEKGKERTAPGTKMYSLTKFGQIVLCNAITTLPQNIPGLEDPYAKGGQGITYLGEGLYTTPTGKTVSASKYLVKVDNTTGEYWYSNQVPFSIVKSELNTTVVEKPITTKTELKDFGTGAASVFAQKDFDKCQ